MMKNWSGSRVVDVFLGAYAVVKLEAPRDPGNDTMFIFGCQEHEVRNVDPGVGIGYADDLIKIFIALLSSHD